MDPKERRIQKLETILNVAKAMSTERDLGVLLEEIVEHARSVVDATRGSIFLLDRDKNELWSKVAQGAREIRFPADKGIAGHVAQTKKPLNIPDAYADPRFNPAVDKATGFHTRNMLTVPMISTKEDVVGVLQVLNKNAVGHEAELEKGSPGPPFDAEDEEMLLALGGQAASAIENAILYDEINKLFEGFIAASVVAIESRDPTTSGHSGRVATLTCGLAEVIAGIETGPFAAVTFDYDQMKEIRYASLLHDFGKVGVRENVLVKAEKLYPGEIAVLKARFDFIKRTLEKEAFERKASVYQYSNPKETPELLAKVDADLALQLEETEEILQFLLNCNIPTVLEKGGFERLNEIAAKKFNSYDGAKPFLTTSELVSLSIPKGSLTNEDRLEIESHVTHTYRFLATIPWTSKLRRIPEIAYGHHEKLDGRGYPRSITAAEIPVQTRMMTISDIYDALTASDRPYKKAMPAAKALDILGYEAKEGKVDKALLDLFIDAKVFERTIRG
ncbi:MAG: GAF domain-containing protein [Nitrospirae bacterium]|nr:MAG: GAF domain-containing protein [Nitrospirota bacterium]